LEIQRIGKVCSALLVVWLLAVLVGCGGGSQSNNLQISVASGSVTAGATAQLRAVRGNSDGTQVDVTRSVKWVSSATSVATISPTGLLTALVGGTTTITATIDTASGTLTVAVGAPAVTSVAVTPQGSSVPVGYTEQLIAAASYADGSHEDLTSAPGLVWSVSPASVATISQTGVLTATGAGSFTATATTGGVSAQATGTVTTAVLTGLAITPAGASVEEGATQQFTATATFSDQTSLNVTGSAAWSSSNTSLLTIASTGLGTALTKVTPGAVTVFAQVGAQIASTSVSVVPAVVAGPALTALVVTPTASSLAKNTGQQLMATGYYADGSQQDLSSSVTWQSNNPSTSAVNATGLLTTTTPGAATIQAQIAVPASSARRGVHGNAITTLQAQSVSLVTSATLVQVIAQSTVPTIPIAAAQQLQLFGIFSDGTKQDLTALATWTSTDATVATVSSSGVAMGVAAGAVTFTGSFGGQSDTTPTLQVTNSTLDYLTLEIASTVVVTGSALPITVTGHYSDGSTQELTSQSAFSSSNPAAITVNSGGAILGIAPGESTITATVQGQSATIRLADTAATLLAVTVVPSSASFANGTTLPFQAIANFSDGASVNVTAAVTWGTTAPSIFTVDATGLAKSGSVGTASVTASFLGTTGISGAVTVSSATVTGVVVSPASVMLASGTSQQLTAVATFSDGTTQDVTAQANWAIANNTIAQTSNSGNAVAIAPGSTQETASLMGFTGSTNVFVVSGATLASVAITPANPILAVSLTEQLHLIGSFSDGTTQDLTQCALWSTSEPNVANIVLPGLVQSPLPGTSTVTASCGGASAYTTLTAVNKTVASAAIVPSQAQVAVGGDVSFEFVLTFTDGSTQNLDANEVWSSSDPTIGTLAGPVAGEDAGHAIGISPGKVTITAVSAFGQRQTTSQTATLYVTSKPISSVLVTPASPTIAAGGTQQFIAQATYTDGSGGDISGEVEWSSSNPSLVSISASGLATGQPSPAGGSATITATTGAFIASTVVTVPADLTDHLTAIQVVPTSSRIANGTPQQLTALGTYTDGTTRDISSVVAWTSANPAVATVSATGLVTGASVGTVTLQAQLGTLQSPSTVIVTPATLVSVSVSPSGATFANGTTQQFRLIGTFSDGSTQDLSAGASWQSSNPSVATISSTGLATGTGVGSVVISSTFDGQTASTSPSQVSAANLVSISVQPNSASYAKGTSQQFSVTGSYSDGTTENLTGLATWQSSNPSVVNISTSGLATGVGIGSATVTATAGGQSATTGAIQISAPALTSISITPGSPSIAAGTTQQFTAIGTFSDATTEDLTDQVVWASSTPSVATINQYGVAESGNAGSTQIFASYEGVTATTGTVQVTGATLTGFTISPTSGSVAKGTTQQFTATGTFSDGSTENLTSQVNWSTSDSTTLTINSSGLATGVGNGSASVSATIDGQTMSTSALSVTPATLVSVAVSPATASIIKGSTQQYILTGTFSDSTTQNLSGSASWSSSNTALAGISSTGLATGVAVGTTTITGQSGSQSATAQLTITAATLVSIAVTPTSGSLPDGTRQQFTVIATYSDGSTQNVSSATNWISSNTSVITIDANGLATAVGIGAVNITAQYGGQTYTTSAFSATPPVLASITITPANTSIVVNGNQQYTATGTYTDGSTQNLTGASTWSSSTTGVATIGSSSGLATGAGAGTTTIQAQDGTVSATTQLTVTSAPVTAQGLVITPSAPSIAKGTHQQFAAAVQYSDGSSQDVTAQTTWSSATSSVATINSSGLALGVSGGTSQITGSYTASGTTFSNSVQLTVSAATLSSLAITPTSASIANGTTQQFTAIGTLSDGSTQDLTNSVTWTSNNTNDATISTTGLATAHTNGSTTITAQSGTVTSNTATLTITTATVSGISVQPGSISAAAGATQQLLVTANFTDGSSQNVTQSSTYTSSAPSIATVSSGGLVTTVAQGTATVTVTLNANTATVPVAVSMATLQSIAITPSPLSLAAGSTQQLTATGTYSDGSTANLTNAVAWSSSASGLLTVSTTGLLTSSNAGNATVTATLNSATGMLQVTVTSAVIRTISVTPANATLAAGQTQQYTAIATLSDGTQQTETSSAHWSVSDSTRATISNASGTTGLLTSVAGGTDTVIATIGSITGQATVTITTATLSSIAVAPAAFTLATGTTQQLTVTGTYSDGSSQNLTGTAVYSSNASATASVSSTGLVTGTAAVTGVATITATVGTQTATATATVTPNTLLAIAVTPATTTIANGLTQQFTATGTYAGNQQNITSQVQWTSSNTAVATINAAGLARSVGPGVTTITATSGGTSGNTTLTVGSGLLQSITVQSVQNSFALGQQLQLQAIGNYSDGTTQNLTSSVTWTSLNTAVGVVSQAGVASGVKAGVFGAQATLGSISGSTALTVTSAVLQSITVTPANMVLVSLAPVQYTAIGHFSDGTTENLTDSVHWSTTSALLGIQVGTISQTGQLSAVAVGAGTVVAAQGTVSGATNFTVASL
jgi:uncharacterized protein YjdB